MAEAEAKSDDGHVRQTGVPRGGRCMRDSPGRWCLIGGLVLIVVSAFVGGAARGANAHANYRAVCAPPVLGSVHCHSAVVVDGNGNPAATKAPTGLSPATIKSV